MAFLTRNRAIYVAPETTPGDMVDPLDVANDGVGSKDLDIRIRNLEYTIDPELDDENSAFLTGDLGGADESIVGKIPGTIKYGIKFAPGEYYGLATSAVGNATHNLNWEDMVEAAGLYKEDLLPVGETTQDDYFAPMKRLFYPSHLNTSKTMTQTVVEKNENDDTFAVYYNGSLNNLKITADGVGKPLSLDFEGMGGVNKVIDLEATIIDYGGDYNDFLSNIKFNDNKIMRTVASKFLNTTIKIREYDWELTHPSEPDGGWVEFCINKFEFDTGGEITPIECQDNSSGIKYYQITNIEPRLAINPELKTLSEFDFYKALTEEKKYEVEIIVSDKRKKDEVEFVPLRIYIPRAQLIKTPITDDNGFLRYDMSFRPLRNAVPTTGGTITPKVPVIKLEEENGSYSQWVPDANSHAKSGEALYYIITQEEYIGDNS